MKTLTRFPVDTSAMKIKAEGPSAPVAVYEGTGDNSRRVEGAQAKDPVTGVNLWTVELSTITENRDGKKERVSMKVKFQSATDPGLELEDAVRVTNLVATPVNGATYFSAASVVSAAPVKQG